MKKIPVTLREATSNEHQFVFNSWLKSYKDSYFAMDIPAHVYYQEHHNIVKGLIERSKVLLAVNQDDDDQILGFVVFEPGRISFTPVIHYMYVKSPFRYLGVGTELFEEALHACKYDESLPIIVTHYSKQFKRFCNKIFLYNPYLIGDYFK